MFYRLLLSSNMTNFMTLAAHSIVLDKALFSAKKVLIFFLFLHEKTYMYVVGTQ